ncbi:MAG: hypothetical protein KDC38_09665, partial [Planctomycetes bacterium]|nr:hypothetical protein [Planctomycetota bacterium]
MTPEETPPEIDLETWWTASASGATPVTVDVRSPSEFEIDHMPGARSVPLFDDRERAVVGTLYRH